MAVQETEKVVRGEGIRLVFLGPVHSRGLPMGWLRLWMVVHIQRRWRGVVRKPLLLEPVRRTRRGAETATSEQELVAVPE